MKSRLLAIGLLFLAFAGCATDNGEGAVPPPTGSGGTMGSGGATGSGGSRASGGTTGSGGTIASGGTIGSGGTTGSGGEPGSGGATASGGARASGGRSGSGGSMGAAGGPGTGGTGAGARGGNPGASGAPGTAGATGAAGAAGSVPVDCSTAMPTGGSTYTGSNVNGMADGLNYGIWSNGSGGSITVFPSAHAFSASWNNGGDFLAHVGLDFNTSKAWSSYGTIAADFVEKKSGSGGGYSSIGMYGWTHNPCVEWYINEDSYNGLSKTSTTATIDGGTYSLKSNSTTGTGGNACEAGHSGGWTQMWSYRQTARQCGTITVSDHFAAWEKQGWKLGTLSSVHINVEVGGGTGMIQFPVANVTTTSK